jgi:hypothetical protein
LHGRKGGFVRDSIADIESFRPGSPGWPASIGMGGRLPSESVAGLRRNQWPLCVGLRKLKLTEQAQPEARPPAKEAARSGSSQAPKPAKGDQT